MSAAVYADSRYRAMQAVTGTEGIRAICYDQQTAVLESLIQPGMTVLDVGCGPSLPYRAPHAYVIGLDPSAASLAVNTDVDDRIVGSAEVIPLPDASVDIAVALYSVHHMTADAMLETDILRVVAFAEMARVVKPGGSLLVFEMTPGPLGWAVEQAVWNAARWLLGSRLDMCFWPTSQYERLGQTVMPDATLTQQTFTCPPFATFAPIFALPWLKLPRCLYPLTPMLYHWRFPDGD